MLFNQNIFTLFRVASMALGLMLLGSLPARAQLNLGFTGGMAGSVTSEGIANFSETKFRPSRTYDASVGYRFSNGMTLGVRAEQLQLGLRENGSSLGSLTMKPFLLSIGYQGRPSEGRGFAGHVQVGGGMALTNFNKGSALTSMEGAYGARLNILTDNAPVFELGAGFDYFVSRHVSFSSDFRILFANVATQWSAVGRQMVPIPDIERFYASNGQAVGGIKFWLK